MFSACCKFDLIYLIVEPLSHIKEFNNLRLESDDLLPFKDK